MSEDTQEGASTNDEYDQDSSISSEDDTDSTSSQEEQSEDWIECMQRSARQADEKKLTHIETEMATSPPDRHPEPR